MPRSRAPAPDSSKANAWGQEVRGPSLSSRLHLAPQPGSVGALPQFLQGSSFFHFWYPAFLVKKDFYMIFPQGIWAPGLPSSKEMAHLPLHHPWSPTPEQGPCCHFVLTKMSIHMAYSEQWHTLPQGKLSLRLVGDRTRIVVLSGSRSSSYLSG